MLFDSQNIPYLLGIGGLVSLLFAVYNSFRNPQIKGDQDTIRIREDLDTLQGVVDEIKEKHLASVEENIKDLSQSVHGLAINVTRLTTIIDERIPKSTK